jgi:hypothetical protein
MENALVSDINQFQNTHFGIWNKSDRLSEAMRTIPVEAIVNAIVI